MKYFNDARDIFFSRRFGMFIHWGLYCIPAWHEQLLWRGKIKRKEYEKLVQQFNPVNFDPDLWVRTAKDAGMEYICFTTKHHDGFCMFDTKHTGYNVMNTPYGKDVLLQLSQACEKHGLALSLYYSDPDWHHPNYPNQGRHHQMFGPRPGDDPDIDKYYAYVKNQIEELLTNYGKIYELFWDVNVDEYHDPSLNEFVRKLQPGILINDRGPDAGDYQTPERRVPEGKAFTRPTEGNSAFGRESWGFKTDEDYYSDKHLMQSMDKILAMGGNYLLNIGPRPDGTFPEENVRSLRKIGDWYKSVRESFIDTYPASYMVEADKMSMSSEVKIDRDEVWVTRKDNTLYIHMPKDPQSTAMLLIPLDILPKRATLLNDGRELETVVSITPWHWREKPYLRIRGLPVNEMAGTVMVAKLEFDTDECE